MSDYTDDEWEEITPPARQQQHRRLVSVVSVRFAPREVDTLRRAAEARSQTLSEFVRNAALAAAGLGAASSQVPVTTSFSGQSFDFDVLRGGLSRFSESGRVFTNVDVRVELLTGV